MTVVNVKNGQIKIDFLLSQWTKQLGKICVDLIAPNKLHKKLNTLLILKYITIFNPVTGGLKITQYNIRRVLHVVEPKTDKRTWLNHIFKLVQKKVHRGIRTSIFDIILYVVILRLYMIVHILLVHFSIAGTIKF